MGIMKPWINFLMAFTRVMAMLVMVVGVGLAYTVLGQDWSQGLAESHIQAGMCGSSSSSLELADLLPHF